MKATIHIQMGRIRCGMCPCWYVYYGEMEDDENFYCNLFEKKLQSNSKAVYNNPSRCEECMTKFRKESN